MLIQAGVRARVPGGRACSARARSRTTCSTASPRCTGCCVVAVLAYAASYFARGWLAGHQWFALYGGARVHRVDSRLLFAVAVAVGIAEGQSVVAMGMAAAPFVSLVVVPLAFSRRPQAESAAHRRRTSWALARAAVASRSPCWRSCWPSRRCSTPACSPPTLTATDAAVAGYVFNALLIARAPLQLFQAVQGSLLPHLAGLEAHAGRGGVRARDPDHDPRHRRLRAGRRARAAGDRPVRDGPAVRRRQTYGRFGLAAVALGHGLPSRRGHAQPGGARRATTPAPPRSRGCSAAAVFLAWMLADVVDDELLRAEVGYLGAASLLCALLAVVYRRPANTSPPAA